MWPLYLLLNKFLGAEEEHRQGSAENHLSLVQPYALTESSNEGKNNDTFVSCSRFIEVPHINQVHAWDCGLACVLMVLKTLGINNYNLQDLVEICSTTSIWTVDLAYLLKKFSVNFSYFTVTLGADPSFSGETFYKEQLPTDLLRVNVLFQEAREAGITIERRSITADEISALILSRKYIAIALVDQYKLSHSWLEDLCLSGLHSGRPEYTGHFVVICEYDSVRDEFEIRDPASSRKDEWVTSKCLEGARKSFGTDEDLLLISLDTRESKEPLVESIPTSLFHT